MDRIICHGRQYCKVATGQLNKDLPKKKVDFSKLRRSSVVPNQAISTTFEGRLEKIEIDNKTIQLLERLSLVDFDREKTLEILKRSIEFAEKISNINTDNVKPLYTVLEDQALYLRDDQAHDDINSRDEILKNAKLAEEDYFIAPPGNIPLYQEENNSEKFEN